MPFPTGFEFGGQMDISYLENEQLRHRTINHLADSRMPLPGRWAKKASGRKMRRLRRENALRQDETTLDDIDDPIQYWEAVMKLTPPREWVNVPKLIVHLSKIRIKSHPSIAPQWTSTKKWLDEVIRQGNLHAWSDDSQIVASKMETELWETFRLNGCSRRGYGIYPRHIRDRMVKAGLNWLALNPKTRIMPKCWVNWADENGFEYAGVRYVQGPPTVHNETQPDECQQGIISVDRETPVSTESNPEIPPRQQIQACNIIADKSRESITGILRNTIMDGPAGAQIGQILNDGMSKAYEAGQQELAARLDQAVDRLDKTIAHERLARTNNVSSVRNDVRDVDMGLRLSYERMAGFNLRLEELERSMGIRHEYVDTSDDGDTEDDDDVESNNEVVEITRQQFNANTC